MLTKESVVDNYINKNKSIAQMCFEFSLTKKKFTNLCRKYGIVKDRSLQRMARVKSATYDLVSFIKRAEIVHNNKYDYSKSDYVKSNVPIIIICPVHGEFSQKPVTHLQGYGCQVCGGSNKLNTTIFIERSKEIHGDLYDYSLVDYKNMIIKVSIICRIHGTFVQRPSKHLYGHGCPKCNLKEKLSSSSFIERARKVHGNLYDYSLVDYKGIDSPVSIICSVHGEFVTTPYLHLRHKCGKCMVKVPGNVNYCEEFIKKAREVHGDKYDYDLVSYFNSYEHVLIVCPIHGKFSQAPYDHLQGKGCGTCAGNVKLSTDEFINRSKLKHGDLYDYSRSVYKSSHENVTIICKNHGPFEQVAIGHYNGFGCPKCPKSISKPQQEIADYIGDSSLCYNDRSVISPYEIDLYIGDRCLGFEVNGLFWHSYDRIESTAERNKHKFKQDLCDKIGVRLIQVFEHEWAFKRGIVESHIDVLLGRCNRIFARACEVVVLDSKGFNEFCGVNHLQGILNSKVRYGLVYKGDLVMVMGFNGCGDFVCTRLCSKLGLVVVGGVSRLFSRFVRDYCPSSVVSFADRRYSVGGVYEKLGFKRLYVTSPNYFYVKGMDVFSRIRFQKHKLGGVLGLFDGSLTEAENMFLNGYRRLWDAGHIKYLWRA